MSENKSESFEIQPDTKYSEIERYILFHLYDHPGWEVTTLSLANAHPPGDDASQAAAMSFKEVQYGIETLVADQLVSGERKLSVDALYFDKLKLTRKGEAEAIRQKRCLPIQVTHSVPRPHRE